MPVASELWVLAQSAAPIPRPEVLLRAGKRWANDQGRSHAPSREDPRVAPRAVGLRSDTLARRATFPGDAQRASAGRRRRRGGAVAREAQARAPGDGARPGEA